MYVYVILPARFALTEHIKCTPSNCKCAYDLIFRSVRKILKSDHELRHVCLSVFPSAWNRLGSHWTDCHEVWYMCIFRKSVDKIQVSINSDTNNSYFTLRPIYIFDHISLNSSNNDKRSDKCCRDIKTHVLCSIFFFENFAFWEIMSKNFVEPDRPQMTIQRMCIAC
jgi:hypothetical protein